MFSSSAYISRNLQGREMEILLALQGKNLIRDICDRSLEALTILGMHKSLYRAQSDGRTGSLWCLRVVESVNICWLRVL